MIFHFFQTRLGGSQQGSARDILESLGHVLQKHIKLSETSIRRQRIDFSVFEVRTEDIISLFLLPVFFLLLPAVLFLPSFPARFLNPQVSSADCYPFLSFQHSILSSLCVWQFIHLFSKLVFFNMWAYSVWSVHYADISIHIFE